MLQECMRSPASLSGEDVLPGFVLDFCWKRCRDVALLRLIKGFGQRIVQFGRCLLDLTQILT